MALRVAAIILGDGQIVVVIDMAQHASGRRVRALQQESGFAVLGHAKYGCRERIKVVAALAIGWLEIRGERAWRRRNRLVRRVVGLLKIRHVARLARSRQSQIIPGSRVLMALIALHDGVCAKQRESIEMLRNRLNRNLPAGHGVALRAVRAELAAMNVRVAVGAVLADIGENRLDVAAGARHLLVHAAQRVPGRIVVKFGDRADRSPARCRVAIFARDVQRSVRAFLGLSLRGCGQGNGDREQNAEPPGDVQNSSNVCPQ